MKRILPLIIILCSISCFLSGQTAATQPALKQGSDILIPLGTKNTDLIYKANGRDGRLVQVYLGSKLSGTSSLSQLRDAGHQAYATFGTDNLFEPAIRMTHNDGNPSLELKYVSHVTETPGSNITFTKILLRDPEYPVEVTLNVKTFNAEDVVEQWVEIVQKEAKPVILYNYASSMLHFDADKYWLSQFHGDWAEEMRMQESELTSGIKIIDTKLGTRAHMYQTPVFFLSLNEKSDEKSGELIAGTLGWSGNFRFLFEIDKRIHSALSPG